LKENGGANELFVAGYGMVAAMLIDTMAWAEKPM
jgi:hypothetical protein